MDLSQLFSLFVASRVLHVTTAVVLVGGGFFLRYVLMPAASSTLSDAEHDKLRGAVVGHWKKFVHGGIGVMLLSGLFNYFKVILEGTHKGDGLYHGLIGTKILLALGIFFIASALVGRSAGTAGIRQNARKWLTVNFLLALVIIAISGFLRMRGVPAPKGTAAAVTAVASPK
ncbi:MAG: hypothetical protein ACK5WR_12255 [Planctomycetaceae bacterium]|jgi:uncharacterized membrane protein